MEFEGHLYSYLYKVEFYDYLHLHLYEVNLYSHLHWHLYGKYSYGVSTKISLRSHLYHQNLKCVSNIFGDLWLHLNKWNLKHPNRGYHYIHHYNHMWNTSTSLLHIICLIITIVLTPVTSNHYVSLKWITTIVSTCISKEWNSTVISTCIPAK